MLKLSTKGRYGSRLMLDLALYSGKGPVFLKDIARRQGISEKYLWHLVPPLKNAGLVHSIRGVHGGYVLTRPPAKVTLKEILFALEGPVCMAECVHDARSCRRTERCVFNDIWRDIEDTIQKRLSALTLEHIVEKQKNKTKEISYDI